MIFAGTTGAAGTAKAVVYATGMNTAFGKIAHLTQSVETELSPLQKEIKYVTKAVTVIAVGIGLLFFFISVLLAGMKLLEAVIFAIGMIVAFVPEGLLPTVTLALAMGVQRMASATRSSSAFRRWRPWAVPPSSAPKNRHAHPERNDRQRRLAPGQHWPLRAWAMNPKAKSSRRANPSL